MTVLPVVPDWLDVSRETFEKLTAYCDLVRRWNPAINMIAKSTIADVWGRHLLDSAQIFEHCPPTAGTWLDLGSGAGFPGLVVAILAVERQPELRVTLVESDRRKSVFLGEVIRQLGLKAQVMCHRIEDIEPQGADVVSARALAPLSSLCAHASRHLCRSGTAIFLKGAQAADELTAARLKWQFHEVAHPSRTDENATILVVKDIRNV